MYTQIMYRNITIDNQKNNQPQLQTLLMLLKHANTFYTFLYELNMHWEKKQAVVKRTILLEKIQQT